MIREPKGHVEMEDSVNKTNAVDPDETEVGWENFYRRTPVLSWIGDQIISNNFSFNTTCLFLFFLLSPSLLITIMLVKHI